MGWIGDYDLKEEKTIREGRLLDLAEQQKKAILVGVYGINAAKEQCTEQLEELENLGSTYGLTTVLKMPCPLREYNAGLYVGKGKAEEIGRLVEQLGCNLVVFDDEISPQQQRNLEKCFQCAVIDRTELILGVFAQRAKTREAKLQIELAAVRYQLPRLRRLWTHLSRQRTGGAGGGYLKGEGEKQIEIDRRILKRQAENIQKEIEQVALHRKTQKRERERTGIPTFAIIGYTNAGKSTLMNALTDADVFVEDKLFATLDTTTRKFVLANKQPVLLIDTVGFIRKIPHTLVAAFKSTLEEALQADILLHLVDAGSPTASLQMEATFDILRELGASSRPTLLVLNKADQCQDLPALAAKYPGSVAISALHRTGLDALLDAMMRAIASLRTIVFLRVPQSNYADLSDILREGKVLARTYEENDILLEVEISKHWEHKVAHYVVAH